MTRSNVRRTKTDYFTSELAAQNGLDRFRLFRQRANVEKKPRMFVRTSHAGNGLLTKFSRAFVRSVVRGIALLAMAALMISADARADAVQDLLATSATASTQVVDHSAWDKLLKTYVKPSPDGMNRVDYAAFKSGGQKALKLYIARLEAINPHELDRAEQFALLANLYNAKTIDIVLDHYPVNSIKDISLGGGLLAAFTGGPWKAKVTRLGGLELSLDEIEHGILRPIFKDPRVHYAVNCASIGCPNLGTEAFTGAKLNQQLDAAARAFINHPRGVAVQGDTAAVSSIYTWFKEDFGGEDSGVLAHLRKYASGPLAEKLRAVSSINYQNYDWGLNDVKR